MRQRTAQRNDQRYVDGLPINHPMEHKMKLKFPEDLSHFYNSSGNEFKPDADGTVTTDHSDTIAEMLRAGFVKIEKEIKEVVHEVGTWITRLLHHESGDVLADLPVEVKVGDTVGVPDEDGNVVDHEVVTVSTDRKTAVVKAIEKSDSNDDGLGGDRGGKKDIPQPDGEKSEGASDADVKGSNDHGASAHENKGDELLKH